MSVMVCDAIMGSGKSSAAITYINEHPERKFIYITPYLEEAARIKKGCPEAHFVEPSSKSEQYNFKKTLHAQALIEEGHNIASTHQAFRRYTPEMLQSIRDQKYTLIIDEDVDILELADISEEDINCLVELGFLLNIEDSYIYTGKEYHGRIFMDILKRFENMFLMKGDGVNTEQALYFWKLSPELITSFDDVFILTYLFKAQSLHHMLEMNHIDYGYIGITHTDSEYRFNDFVDYIPDYVKDLCSKVHILDNARMNSIGDGKYDLSMSWFDKDSSDIAQLKNNMDNYYHHILDGPDVNRRLWGTFLKEQNKLKVRGCARSFLPFNAKATNKYRDRDCLMYLANVYMNTGEKLFYRKRGVDVSEDDYALSILVQWLWRSAIRDGRDINIYIPSSRMRQLLIDWMEKLSKGEYINE